VQKLTTVATYPNNYAGIYFGRGGDKYEKQKRNNKKNRKKEDNFVV